MSSLLIQNAFLIDGTGREGFAADLFLENGLIREIGSIDPSKITLAPEQIFDAKGKVVCPGFVDIHRHCDAKFLLDPQFGDIELAQGITTIVVGNCGMSLTPSPENPARAAEMYAFMEPVIGSGCFELGLHHYEDYLDALDRAALRLNVASMIGMGSLKISLKGFSDSAFSPAELEQAAEIVRSALKAGAAGVSAGIMYLPECYSTADEMAAILRPLGECGAVLTAHIRGEGDSLIESVQEIIEVGRKSGCAVQISHFKSCGIENWNRDIFKAIECIEAARAKGQDVTCDFYPYEGGSTALTTMLPPDFVAGDLSRTIQRLGTAEGIEAFRRASLIRYDDWDNYAVTLGWDRMLIGSVHNAENRRFLGLTVSEAAAQFGFSDPASCAAHLMHSDEGKTALILMSMSQADIDVVAKLPYSLVISDSIYADTDTPHPRMYGAFPKIICEYVGERKILTLPQAVHKMTQMPAERMGLDNRGVLKVGAAADVIVFDPEAFRDHATFTAPAQAATGLALSVIDGEIVWRDGKAVRNGEIPPAAGKNLRRGR